MMSDRFEYTDSRKNKTTELIIDLAIIVHDVGNTMVAARLLHRRGIPLDTAMRVLFNVDTRRNTDILSRWRLPKNEFY